MLARYIFVNAGAERSPAVAKAGPNANGMGGSGPMKGPGRDVEARPVKVSPPGGRETKDSRI